MLKREGNQFLNAYNFFLIILISLLSVTCQSQYHATKVLGNYITMLSKTYSVRTTLKYIKPTL